MPIVEPSGAPAGGSQPDNRIYLSSDGTLQVPGTGQGGVVPAGLVLNPSAPAPNPVGTGITYDASTSTVTFVAGGIFAVNYQLNGINLGTDGGIPSAAVWALSTSGWETDPEAWLPGVDVTNLITGGDFELTRRFAIDETCQFLVGAITTNSAKHASMQMAVRITQLGA